MANQGNTGDRVQSAGARARDVSAEVFEAFLEALEREKVDAAVIQRLRQVLVEEKTFSERALRAAVFGEGPARD